MCVSYVGVAEVQALSFLTPGGAGMAALWAEGQRERAKRVVT